MISTMTPGKKKMNYQSMIDDVRVKTELLESLEWDEELLDSLMTYLDHAFSHDTHIDDILYNITVYYSGRTSNIVKNVFDEVGKQNMH